MIADDFLHPTRWEGEIRIRGGPRRSFCARIRRDAVHKLSGARWTLGQGLPVSSRAQPLSAYFTDWLTTNRAWLRPVTMATYALDIRRLMPFLGSVRLRCHHAGHDPVDLCLDTQSGALAAQGGAGAHGSSSCVEPCHALGTTSGNPAQMVSPPGPSPPRNDGALGRPVAAPAGAYRRQSLAKRYTRELCDQPLKLFYSGLDGDSWPAWHQPRARSGPPARINRRLTSLWSVTGRTRRD